VNDKLKPFAVGQTTLREIAQSLQEGKKMARSLENLATSLEVLADDDHIKTGLADVENMSRQCADLLNGIYKKIAREALAE